MSHALGQTLWAWHGDEGDVGLAWDWVQLTPGLVAMADPMAVVTNLRLVGDEGEVLSAYESVLHINELVHALPWQQEVERVLGEPEQLPHAARVHPGLLAQPGAAVRATQPH